jgi:hypothetical protein
LSPSDYLELANMIICLRSLLVAATTASIVVVVGAAATTDSADTHDWKFDADHANTLLAQGKYNDAIALYDHVIRTSL